MALFGAFRTLDGDTAEPVTFVQPVLLAPAPGGETVSTPEITTGVQPATGVQPVLIAGSGLPTAPVPAPAPAPVPTCSTCKTAAPAPAPTAVTVTGPAPVSLAAVSAAPGGEAAPVVAARKPFPWWLVGLALVLGAGYYATREA